ncbi:MAG: tRNA (guanosine(46)-N7)-methyltransferase TrmB [Sulfurimonas sp. RIFOXYD12_FULL_33_39]|uniref:tRNA (guanosine(46)-N7)-methyltransferase TrmB n=1 Tax=unclassified Sulfurimonas TaxID=2623549 RepID=UPI0008B53E81|nr:MULTISPECIES: tRNA (guanosine(46)-N7)-methyltransferase TrmB [unclassified Sulfurimonas]OHE01994.1 MAG: tRNA (guanosine(46)-N7)-methyltransferase TrmB [Sulfurimonas sp. RIFCSPLOWO2_12_FULL_34_6]OHE08902.1 MAG: tRNA (guanosine(46)-N7)-methyltransferase TrmB [Sulfurimonas sp. RIFOXYD12_FULL_33_39]OHE14212.1 MAG: tRNA (guanosine(46)-N7)-methyltransferase TrmB [Sulfurimonas sp. RIFOXYD2_FULL_34_21]DAB27978.1 MAG TPA: tRNA (guanosine(46)-N7)-methyltransferase TrmB [Sulfurimonas sp. UBA10385]
MPHLHIAEFNEIEFPSQLEGVYFNFIAQNINHKEEKLISVKVDKDEFFLLVKNEDGKSLLKSDKLTRPASIFNVHKALLSYAKLSNMTALSSNVPQNQKNVHLEKVTALKDINYFATNFPKNKNIRIEVGFGSGRHLLHQAINNPDTMFIGIEIHHPSIEQVLKQITIKNIENLLILNYDARLFMELVPSNIVEKIYVHFPVPWDKKPHRRVISTSFIEEARRVLNLGGTLELRTDSENYYAYSYETFIAFNKTTLHINKNRDIAVTSKYEDRWKKMEKNIYDLTMINDEESKELNLEGGFEFSKVNISSDDILKFHKETQKFESGFIHFERTYMLKDGVMIRLSMGSFDKPEHLYVIVKGERAFYYPALPLKSKSNLLAHQFLDRIFHG